VVRDADLVGPNNRPQGSRSFLYTDHARALVLKGAIEKKHPMLLAILNNITTGREPAVSGWLIALPDVTEPRCISGFANEGRGEFAYKGTVDVQEGMIVVELTSQPESEVWTQIWTDEAGVERSLKAKNKKWRKRVRHTRATIYEEGPIDIDVSYE
jgi:hypothetical protein